MLALFLAAATTVLALSVRGVRLYGVSSDQLGTGSIIAIEPSTAVVAVLGSDRSALTTTDGAVDPTAGVLYFFADGFMLRSFELARSSFGRDVIVKLNPCVGGGSCVNELHWEAKERRLVGVGVGLCPVPTKPNGLCPSTYQSGVNTAISL